MQKLNSKGLLSALLVVAVSSLFSFSSLTTLASNEEAGMSNIDESVTAARDRVTAPAGVLAGTGTLSLNGISAQSGATVFSGSIITTGHDGIASIDLGPVGRFVVRPRTSVTVTLNPTSATIADRAKGARVSVLRGEVSVTSAGASRVLKAGDDARFAESIEAAMTSDTVFTIQDQGAQKDQGQKDSSSQGPANPTPSPSPSPSPKRRTAVIVPWWGWVGLAGAAGGIAAGVAA